MTKDEVQEAAIGTEVEVEVDTIVTRPREAVTRGRMVVGGGTAGRLVATMTVTGGPFVACLRYHTGCTYFF